MFCLSSLFFVSFYPECASQQQSVLCLLLSYSVPLSSGVKREYVEPESKETVCFTFTSALF